MKDKLNNIKIESIFLFIAIIIGIMFVFITPPFQGPDEYNHFYRAYQISEFQFLAKQQQNQIGGDIPTSITETMTQVGNQKLEFHAKNKQSINMIVPLLKMPLNKDVKGFEHFENTAIYFPIMYLPQSVGILIGRVFNLSPLILMYLGRTINLVSWSFLTFLAIKIMPLGKRTMLILALAPMAVFQAASFSADGVINSLAFLTIAVFIIYAFDEKRAIHKKDIIIIFLVSMILALCKQSYFLISLLFLLIPVKKMESKKRYYLLFISLMFSNIIVILAWTYCVKYAILPLAYRPNVSAVSQLLYIIKDPVNYIHVLSKTFFMYWHIYITGWVGRLGWFDTVLPPKCIDLYLLMVVFTALTDSKVDIEIDVKKRLIIFMTLILELILIVSLIYLSFDTIGFTYIAGVQGRYFIPVGPLFCLLFYNKKCSIYGKKIKWITSSFSAIFLVITLFVLINRYYL